MKLEENALQLTYISSWPTQQDLELHTELHAALIIMYNNSDLHATLIIMHNSELHAVLTIIYNNSDLHATFITMYNSELHVALIIMCNTLTCSTFQFGGYHKI